MLQLEGSQFSTDFKDFVWQCLRKVGGASQEHKTALASRAARAVICGGSVALAQLAWQGGERLGDALHCCRAQNNPLPMPTPPTPPRLPPPAVWQDPADRPTATDLLEHPFVAGAETAPPELAQRVTAYLQRRPALLEKAAHRASSAGGGYGTVGATVPRWDFAGPAAGAAGAAGAAAPGGTVVSRPVTAPPQPEGGAMLRTGAGLPADEFGTVVRRHTEGPPGSAAAAAAAADYGGTVQVRPAGGGGLGSVAPPSRLVIPGEPTQPDWPTPGAAGSYAARPASAAGAAAAGPDGGASRQLLQAGLAASAAGPGAAPGAAAAADTAAAALGQLEAARPGAVADALTEVLTQLSLSSSPALAALKGSAAALFGGGDAAAEQAGDVPELGPLGRFLMQRWREATARERVAHAQQWQAS